MKSKLSIKDFLPYNFYCIQDVKKEKEDLLGIKVLLILMVGLGVVCINTLTKQEIVEDNSSNVIENNDSNKSFDNLLAWLELYDNNLRGEIQNNSGNLIVNNELLNKFYVDENFTIKSIELKEEDLYKVSIERN